MFIQKVQISNGVAKGYAVVYSNLIWSTLFWLKKLKTEAIKMLKGVYFKKMNIIFFICFKASSIPAI